MFRIRLFYPLHLLNLRNLRKGMGGMEAKMQIQAMKATEQAMEALEAMTWYTSLHFDFEMLKSRPETNIYLVLKYLKYCSKFLVLQYL